MKAEMLKPQVIRPERVETPQCETPVAEPYPSWDWRKDRYSKLRPHFDPSRCQHESVFKLDGKYLCKKHAGIYALEKWMKGELVAAEVHPDYAKAKSCIEGAVKAAKEMDIERQAYGGEVVMQCVRDALAYMEKVNEN